MEKTAKESIDRMRDNQRELVRIIESARTDDGAEEVMPGLFLSRSSKLMTSPSGVLKPAFCFVAQGSKRAMLGNEVFHYDPGNYLIFTVDLPLTFQVHEATEDMPYLGMRLNLDPEIVASVMSEAEIGFRKTVQSAKAMSVVPVDPELLDAVVRLVRLTESPNDRKLLAPLITKEIVYRLLSGGQGERLGHMIGQPGTHRISQAIGRLRDQLDKPLNIPEMAHELGMSVSGFHHHFKSVTAMSPLQYHKQIRLQEARRLMLIGSLDAAAAGFRVGYEDPAYFSRDYKKQFGAPPRRDTSKEREMDGEY
jgi:AraC-like DNA-binding protein